MAHRKDVDLLGQVLLVAGLFRRSPLGVGVLRWETARFIRCGVPAADDSNVKVIEFEGAADADDVRRVDIEMDECGIAVTVNAMDIRQSARDVAGDAQSLQRLSLGLVGQLSDTGAIGEFRHDGMAAEAKDVNYVRRGREPFHRDGVDSIVLKVRVLKVVHITQRLQNHRIFRIQIQLPRMPPKSLGAKQLKVLAGVELQFVHAIARRMVGRLPVLHRHALSFAVGFANFHLLQPLIVGIKDGVELRVVREFGGILLDLAGLREVVMVVKDDDAAGIGFHRVHADVLCVEFSVLGGGDGRRHGDGKGCWGCISLFSDMRRFLLVFRALGAGVLLLVRLLKVLVVLFVVRLFGSVVLGIFVDDHLAVFGAVLLVVMTGGPTLDELSTQSALRMHEAIALRLDERRGCRKVHGVGIERIARDAAVGGNEHDGGSDGRHEQRPEHELHAAEPAFEDGIEGRSRRRGGRRRRLHHVPIPTRVPSPLGTGFAARALGAVVRRRRGNEVFTEGLGMWRVRDVLGASTAKRVVQWAVAGAAADVVAAVVKVARTVKATAAAASR
mmetsp:Transcript_13944/g.39672  ORF Transcript_13944/g.39672 Transcript_13944/m.39672 type:complete len:557 (-) Transcript_13944:981-2651(-)